MVTTCQSGQVEDSHDVNVRDAEVSQQSHNRISYV